MRSNNKTRKNTYFALSNQLAHLNNKQLDSLLSKVNSRQGWGKTHIVTINASKVFVKTIPITDIEYDNLFSTKNLYRLPTFYNYGVGSAGFGAFRELVTHIKTTNWVLDGSIDNFPLMYHYRIIPCRKKPPTIDIRKHQRYVKYWNNDKNISKYIKDRCRAKYQMVIFLEYIPYVLASWLPKNIDMLDTVMREMCRTISFLRKNGIVHFDVHFWNILTDGRISYLTDFGLTLDRSFELSRYEREFLVKHKNYDYAEFLYCLGSYVHSTFDNLTVSKKKALRHKYHIQEDAEPAKVLAIILRNLEKIHAASLIKLDERYVKKVIRHRSVISLMNDFYSEIRIIGKKTTPYPYIKVRNILSETPFR